VLSVRKNKRNNKKDKKEKNKKLNEKEIKKFVKNLPEYLRKYPSLRYEISLIMTETFPTRDEFNQLLKELKESRVAAEKRFEEHNRRFEAILTELREFKEYAEKRFEAILTELREFKEYAEKRFEEHNKRFEAILTELREFKEYTEKRFEEHNRRFEAILTELREFKEYTEKRFEEHNRRFEAILMELREFKEYAEKRFEEHDRKFEEIVSEMKEMRMEMKQMKLELRELRIGLSSLGGRMGKGLEEVIRQVIEDYSGIGPLKAEKISIYDKDGFVFGRPQNIEFDAYVTDGKKFVVEVKNYTEKDDVNLFHRKCEFLKKELNIEDIEMVIMTPVIEKSALSLCKELGITVHAFSVID